MPLSRCSTSPPRPLLTLAVALALAAALTARPAVAAEVTDSQLAAVPVGSSSASFELAGVPGLVLTITELTGATMQGSDLFGYTGLWLGADGGGGQYRIAVNRPVTQLSLDFVALTSLGGEELEWLSDLTTDRPARIQLLSPDDSAAWDGSTLVPLAEDGRGSLQLQASTALGFSQFGLVHWQAVPLQGWVVRQISLTPLATPVPEPEPMALLVGGGLALWQLGRRRLA